MARHVIDLLSKKSMLLTGLNGHMGIPEAPLDNIVYGRKDGGWSPIVLPVKTNPEVRTVGSGGDFPNISAGLLYADGYSWSSGATLELRILSGTVISDQLRILNKNFGYIKITSIDSEVLVNPSTWLVSDDASRKIMFYCDGSISPRIGTRFTIDVPYRATANLGGIFGLNNSTIVVEANSGFNYFTERAVGGQTSTFSLVGAIFENNRRGVQINQSSFNMDDIIVRNSTQQSFTLSVGNGTLRRALFENDGAQSVISSGKIYATDFNVSNINSLVFVNSEVTFDGTCTFTNLVNNNGLYVRGCNLMINSLSIINDTVTTKTYGMRVVNSVIGTNDYASALKINGRFTNHMRLQGSYFNHIGTTDCEFINTAGTVTIYMIGGECNLGSSRLSTPHAFTILNGGKLTANGLKKVDGTLYVKSEVTFPFTPNTMNLSGYITSNLWPVSIRGFDNVDVASATNVGTLRYRTSGNNSYVDMSMQTGVSTYEWVNIVQNNW